LTLDEQIDQAVRDLAAKLQQEIAADNDSYATVKSLDEKIREFNKQRKNAGNLPKPEESAAPESA
jgi:argonaute-like protein implicated in RNA metabolism and viral defense